MNQISVFLSTMKSYSPDSWRRHFKHTAAWLCNASKILTMSLQTSVSVHPLSRWLALPHLHSTQGGEQNLPWEQSTQCDNNSSALVQTEQWESFHPCLSRDPLLQAQIWEWWIRVQCGDSVVKVMCFPLLKACDFSPTFEDTSTRLTWNKKALF